MTALALNYKKYDGLTLKMPFLPLSHCYSLKQSWIHAVVMQPSYFKTSIFANHLVTNQNIKL